MFADSLNLLCVVGWQAPGSTGRRLVDGQSPVSVRHREKGSYRYDWISPLCTIKRYRCFSGHADQEGLLEWLGGIPGVRRAFLVHGEPGEMRTLASRISSDLGLDVEIPRAGERFALCAAGVPAGGE
jgi:metallo-beta-lactamase family protein